MSEKLIVKNFGSIREATLDLQKTTVFIGPQGSGKSTLAKLVAIVKDENFLENKEKITDFKKYQIESFFQDDTYLKFESDNKSQFEVTNKKFSFPNRLSTERKLIELFNEKKDILKSLGFNKPKDLYGIFIGLLFANSNEINKFTQQVGGNLKDELQILINKIKKSQKPLYIPTERFFISSISNSILGLINSKVAISEIITDFGRKFENATSNIKTFEIPYLNLTYKFENSSHKVYIDGKNPVNLYESASGFQSIIPLKLVVENEVEINKNNAFIIEEPELNLFPTIQKEVVNYLVNRCTKGENELLITTHSPYILSALNNLLFAYKTAEKYPERADEIAEKIPRESWLNPAEFNAYYVGEGTVTSIFDETNGLITDNALDEISIDLAGERDFLMDIYFSEVHEGVN